MELTLKTEGLCWHRLQVLCWHMQQPAVLFNIDAQACPLWHSLCLHCNTVCCGIDWDSKTTFPIFRVQEEHATWIPGHKWLRHHVWCFHAEQPPDHAVVITDDSSAWHQQGHVGVAALLRSLSSVPKTTCSCLLYHPAKVLKLILYNQGHLRLELVIVTLWPYGWNLLHQAGHHQVVLQVEFEQYSIRNLGCHCSWNFSRQPGAPIMISYQWVSLTQLWASLAVVLERG